MDQLVDSMDSMDVSGPSPTSILSKLPTKRLDAIITAAAEADLPDQGEQTGGYAPSYAHFAHLVLLPLYSLEQLEILERQHAHKQHKVRHMDANDPDKMFTNSQKVGLRIAGHLTGGANVVSVKRFERRLMGASVVAANSVVSQNKLVVFTRWTVPGLSKPWFVDVFEHRFLESNSKLTSANQVMLKAGLLPSGTKKEAKATFKLLKTDAKGLKSQKTWTKRLNSEPCEAIALVAEDGKVVAMEIVARIQRTCSSLEAFEITKRFDKQWAVPILW